MTSRLLALAIVFAFAIPFTAQADNAGAAKTYVEKVANNALAIIEAKADKTARQQKLERLFAENVNIPWVAKFVMGRHWRDATDAQKKRYLQEYERFVLHHYASRFTDYTSGSFSITGVRDDGDGEFTVNMSLKDAANSNSEPVYVNYRVRKEGGKFHIFDVIVEGVSMITTQRSEFSSVIARRGTDYLIEQLANKSIALPQ